MPTETSQERQSQSKQQPMGPPVKRNTSASRSPATTPKTKQIVQTSNMAQSAGNSFILDDSKIKPETNQKQMSVSESINNLFDGSDGTQWCADFVPSQTQVKLTLVEPVFFTGYSFVLARDHPERDPIAWRVRIKEQGTLNIYEENHSISDHSAEKCPRSSTREFTMRNSKKTSEITIFFDKVAGATAKQIQLSCLLIKSSAVKESNTFNITKVNKKGERSKSADSKGSNGAVKENEFMTFRNTMELGDLNSQQRLEHTMRSEMFRDVTPILVDDSSFKNHYFTSGPKFDAKVSAIHQRNSVVSGNSFIDESRRHTLMMESRNRYSSGYDANKFLNKSIEPVDYWQELYKDFKFKQITEENTPANETIVTNKSTLTQNKRTDLVIDIDQQAQFDQLKKQNEEMYQRLKTTTPTATQISYNFDYNNTYKKYLEDQEKRHSEQIQKIFSQNSEYTSRLTEQIARLQSEKSELERVQMYESKEYQSKVSQLEWKYQTEIKKLEEALNLEKARTCNHDNEVRSLQTYISEQETTNKARLEELNAHKSSVAEVEMRYHQEITKMKQLIQEFDSQVSIKEQECNSLKLKINEIEKNSSFHIESLYKEKTEQERRYMQKVEELNKCQAQLRDVEVSYTLKLEKVQTQITEERNKELEMKYNYQIEQLYSQMSQMEKNYQQQIKMHMEQYQEVEKKYSYQLQISQKQEADQMSKLTFEIQRLKEEKAECERHHMQKLRELEDHQCDMEVKYQKQVKSANNKYIELEVKHHHEVDVLKKANNSEKLTSEITVLHTKISEMEKMHQSQVEKLYLQISEQDKKHQAQIENYKTQIIYLEKRNSEQLAEVKRIYQENLMKETQEMNLKISQMEQHTKNIEIQKFDWQKIMQTEIRSKYEAELAQLQEMNQDLVRKHVKQVEVLYAEKSDLQLSHQAEKKQLNDQIQYLEGKYNSLKAFEEKMAHYEIPETKIIYKYDEGLVTQNAYYEKRHSEMLTQLMQLKEENNSLQSQVSSLTIRIENETTSVNRSHQIEVERLKNEKYELEKKFSLQIENLYNEKQIQEKHRLEKIEQINMMMTQISELEKKHQQTIYTLQSDFAKKESAHLKSIEEMRMQISSSSTIEVKYTQQIERMNHDFQIQEKMYAQQIQTLQDQHAEMEAKFSKQIEMHYTQNADLEKMYSYEMRKLSTQQKDTVSKLESQIKKALEEKVYLETQRQQYSVEVKKLFAVNAELEKKLADKELELKAVYESKESYIKQDQSKFQQITSRITEKEKDHICTIEELQSTQAKLSSMELEYTTQIEQLYAKIADQEARYKYKVDEINTLQSQINNLKIQHAQQSQGLFLKHQIQEEKVSQSMVEITQFKDINAELERKFLRKIEEVQAQNSVFEKKEAEYNQRIVLIQERNRELQLQIQNLQDEQKDLLSIKEKWTIFKTSEENKYQEQVNQLEAYHNKQVETLKAQYETKVYELKSLKENGTDLEKKQSLQIKNLQAQNASFEKRQVEFMEQIRNMQTKYAELQKVHSEATSKFYKQLSEQEKLHSSKVADYTSVIDQVRQLQLSKNELEIKHANQIESLYSQNASLENKSSEYLEEIKKLQSNIVNIQNEFAQYKENVTNENSLNEKMSNSRYEEIRQLDIEIRNTAQLQQVEMERIEFEKKFAKKEQEIKHLHQTMSDLKREHQIELQELRNEHALFIKKYNDQRLEQYVSLDKSDVEANMSIEAKYQIESLKKQIEEMRKLSKYSFNMQSQETQQKQEQQIQFLELKCKNYLDEISQLKSSQEQFSRNQVHFLTQENASLKDQLRSKMSESIQVSYDFNNTQIKSLNEENSTLREQIYSLKNSESKLRFEIEQLQIENSSLKQQLETTHKTIQFMQENDEIKSLKERNSILERKQSQIDKLTAKNNEIKIRYKKKEEEKSADDLSIGHHGAFDGKLLEATNFYHESFQARKGYDTSSMVKFATSIPNIPDLLKKSEADLNSLTIKKVEWSTVNNKFQPPALQSIKFTFSDGSSSAEWGQRDATSFQSYEFRSDVKIGSIGFDYGNFYILQVTFYDEKGKQIVKCGSVGDDSKIKTVSVDSKIVYAYGASSIDNKCVGMIGFTFYKQKHEVMDIKVEVKEDKKSPMKKRQSTMSGDVKVKRISVVNKK